MNQIQTNLTKLTTDYLRTISGLESTLSIILDETEITEKEDIINNIENMELAEMLEIQDISYEAYHILMAMWNIHQTIRNSELFKETMKMANDMNNYEILNTRNEDGESLCHEITHDIIWDAEENQFRLIKIESEYWLEELEEPEVNLC